MTLENDLTGKRMRWSRTVWILIGIVVVSIIGINVYDISFSKAPVTVSTDAFPHRAENTLRGCFEKLADDREFKTIVSNGDIGKLNEINAEFVKKMDQCEIEYR